MKDLEFTIRCLHSFSLARVLCCWLWLEFRVKKLKRKKKNVFGRPMISATKTRRQLSIQWQLLRKANEEMGFVYRNCAIMFSYFALRPIAPNSKICIQSKFERFSARANENVNWFCWFHFVCNLMLQWEKSVNWEKPLAFRCNMTAQRVHCAQRR